jgi:hypothetical protein
VEKEAVSELDLEGDFDEFVPNLVVGLNGIPLMNESLPLDSEILEGYEGEGPKKIVFEY